MHVAKSLLGVLFIISMIDRSIYLISSSIYQQGINSLIIGKWKAIPRAIGLVDGETGDACATWCSVYSNRSVYSNANYTKIISPSYYSTNTTQAS